MFFFHNIFLITLSLTGSKKQSEKQAALFAVRVEAVVYARHGRELMGCPAFAKGYGEARSPLYENLWCSC